MKTEIWVMFTHMYVHHSAAWHTSVGPRGWWTWMQTHNTAAGFGWVQGLLIHAYETRP